MLLVLRHTDYVKGHRSRSRPADDTISPIPIKAISPSANLQDTDVIAFEDMLIRFWGQLAKGQGHSR